MTCLILKCSYNQVIKSRSRRTQFYQKRKTKQTVSRGSFQDSQGYICTNADPRLFKHRCDDSLCLGTSALVVHWFCAVGEPPPILHLLCDAFSCRRRSRR